MPAAPGQRACARCGHTHTSAPDAPAGLPTVHYCPACGAFNVVRDMGELGNRADDANPDEWGHMGWQ